MATKQQVPNQTLRLLSNGESLMIEALDGKATIANAKRVFKSYIDKDFRNWGLDKPGKTTEQMLVDVYEMVQDATFNQIFLSIDANLDKVALTQNQIIRFCKKHSKWLRQEGYGTFFLMKENNEYFVVIVRVYPDGLYVHVHHLEYDHVWLGEFRHRVVSPQLMPLEQ